jgi:hypothetical protein
VCAYAAESVEQPPRQPEHSSYFTSYLCLPCTLRAGLARSSSAVSICTFALGKQVNCLMTYLRLSATASRATAVACCASSTPGVSMRQHASAYVSMRQHASACVSMRQHASAYVSIRQHTSSYVSIRQHTSAYVSIRQHTSAYVSM